MISCTEFIPAYSELFKFIDQRSGRQAVYDYWNQIFQPEKSPLNDYLAKYGLRGCWEYWTVIHIEEACDATMLFSEKQGFWFSCLHSCPSKGRFDKLGYMKPFDEYCKHCDGYDWSAKKYGFVNIQDYRGSDKACCRQMIYDPKVFQGDPHEMVDKLFQCEMEGCKAETTGCPFETEETLKLTTSPRDYKYLHREFHTGMARGAEYAFENYGEDGLREYLTQFTAAYHVPLIAKIKEQGLAAVTEYLTWLYETEEASDALSLDVTDQEVKVTIAYCPAVKFMKNRNYTPEKSYEACTSVVYSALADLSGIGFEMISYNHDTGAAQYRFFIK